MALREREREEKEDVEAHTHTHTHGAHEWTPISKLMLMCDWCAAGVSLSVVCVCLCMKKAKIFDVIDGRDFLRSLYAPHTAETKQAKTNEK